MTKEREPISRRNELGGRGSGFKLTAKGAHILEQQIQMNMIKHNLAAKFFTTRNFWFFTVPQALLTMISSILAFMATTDIFDEKQTVFVTLIVGSTSAVVVFLQTMAGICSYETRGKMHDAVALDLRHLRDSLILLKLKLVFTKQQKKKHGIAFADQKRIADENDSDSNSSKNENNDHHISSFEAIQSRFEQSLAGCKSNVPLQLSEAFHGIKSHLLICTSKDHIKFMVENYGSINDMVNLEFKIYDCLATEILEYWFFPMKLPKAKIMVTRTLKRFKREMKEVADFLDPKTSDSKDAETEPLV